MIEQRLGNSGQALYRLDRCVPIERRQLPDGSWASHCVEQDPEDSLRSLARPERVAVLDDGLLPGSLVHLLELDPGRGDRLPGLCVPIGDSRRLLIQQ